MVCGKCGKEINNSLNICTKCGSNNLTKNEDRILKNKNSAYIIILVLCILFGFILPIATFLLDFLLAIYVIGCIPLLIFLLLRILISSSTNIVKFENIFSYTLFFPLFLQISSFRLLAEKGIHFNSRIIISFFQFFGSGNIVINFILLFIYLLLIIFCIVNIIRFKSTKNKAIMITSIFFGVLSAIICPIISSSLYGETNVMQSILGLSISSNILFSIILTFNITMYSIKKITCKNCGEKIRKNAKYCKKCGSKQI